MQNRSGKQAYDEAYLRCLQRTGSDLQARSEAEEARQEQLRFNRARDRQREPGRGRGTKEERLAGYRHRQLDREFLSKIAMEELGEEEVRRRIDEQTLKKMERPSARAPGDWQKEFKRDPEETTTRYRLR